MENEGRKDTENPPTPTISTVSKGFFIWQQHSETESEAIRRQNHRQDKSWGTFSGIPRNMDGKGAYVFPGVSMKKSGLYFRHIYRQKHGQGKQEDREIQQYPNYFRRIYLSTKIWKPAHGLWRAKRIFWSQSLPEEKWVWAVYHVTQNRGWYGVWRQNGGGDWHGAGNSI